MNLPRIYKTPLFLKKLYPGAIWDKSSVPGTKSVYLTFDDGPIPDITELVLSILDKNQIKATFFVVGDNVSKFPEIFKATVAEGHTIGNHTYNHLKGWSTNNTDYYNNIEKCQQIIEDHCDQTIRLFRPPYGRISPVQIKTIKENYEIIMWDVLTGDYNASVKSKDLLHGSLNATSHGSIVVFHDSIKSSAHIKEVLPIYISLLKDNGYHFLPL